MSLTTDETETLADAIVGANPIVTAIVGAVLVEHELETRLRSRLLKKDDGTWAEMTSDDGPFGTFHKKITAGFALGVCDEIIAHNLNIVRTIRNAFAHSKKLIDFDHPLVMAELDRIRFRGHRDRKQFEREKKTYQLSYQNLCFMLCCEFLRKGNVALQSQKKRLAKKMARIRATLQATAGFGPIGSRGHQNGGPTHGVLKGSPSELPAKRSAGDDKRDK